MREEFSRTAMLIGEEAVQRLEQKKVLVFGVGGVGGYVCEGLARCGVGEIAVVDNDVVSPSNVNRQIIATADSVGKKKTEAMKERILSINPTATVRTYDLFFLPETETLFDFSEYDYIVDSIDTVAGKVKIAQLGEQAGVPVVSAMGAGNKLDPTAFEVSDIYKTSVCPLAKAMRRELKKVGVKKLKVVYSKEEPVTPKEEAFTSSGKKIPASIVFAPAVMGLIMASEIVKDLSKL
ncbi:MAG: tRNA threonylcarbamoyladenosine dehydratase [Clostridia bacterium]|nr:tRNA threonylcarbamoyladenosine dehydratase [Clostridia bacterium]